MNYFRKVLILSLFLLQEKELEKWKCQVKDLESENFTKEQTIRRLQEQISVVSRGVVSISSSRMRI